MIWKPSDENSYYNLDVAYGIVKERLKNIDIKVQFSNSAAISYNDDEVILRYVNADYRIDISNADVTAVSSETELSQREKILILHYFIQAQSAYPSGKKITYRDLPGGVVYYPTFIKRTIKPLSDNFGIKSGLLLEAGKAIGGEIITEGDAGLRVNVFPKVPIDIILWEGDEEFPADVNILFDSNITDFLESEDVTIVCETITWRLIKYLRRN